MLQLLFSGLSSGCVYPTNLLPTGVVITSNNHHRRLLPTDSFGPPNRSIPVMRTEPSFLSNQHAEFACAGLELTTFHDAAKRRYRVDLSGFDSSPTLLLRPHLSGSSSPTPCLSNSSANRP